MDSLLKRVESIPALLGATQDGGGKKRSKKTRKRTVKKSRKPLSKNYRMTKRSVMSRKRPLLGFRYFGGADQFICTKVESPSAVAAPAHIQPVMQQVAPAAPPRPALGIPAASGPLGPQAGGKRAKKMASTIKRYSKMTVEELLKRASRKGIKITKKKDGKTVYVKKATLIRKLCEKKYGKR